MSPRAPSSVHQLKETLIGIRPPIWRRLQVSSTINLRRLHDVIQAAMGWTQSHLYQFEVGNVEYGEPDDEFGMHIRSAKATPLRKVAPEPGVVFAYEYDIEVEQVLLPEPGATYPRCLVGKRACPPEDVGGIFGYEEFLQALRDPKHPGHETMREWAGDTFDPEAFDLRTVNEQLAHLGPSPWD